MRMWHGRGDATLVHFIKALKVLTAKPKKAGIVKSFILNNKLLSCS